MELLNEILSEGWIIFWLGLFLAISTAWAIWLHMAFKYRPDEPCGNDVDNEYKGE